MSATNDDDPVDPALRALLRGAVDDVHPTPDLEGVLAGATRTPQADGPDRSTRSTPGRGDESRVRRPLLAVVAAAAAVASILGIVAGVEQLSPEPAEPPVATRGPDPTPGQPDDTATGDPAPGSGADPLAPVQQPDGSWLVPVYRMMLNGGVDGPASRTYFLEAELTAVDSSDEPSDILAAALTADLPGSVADYGTTVLGDLALSAVDQTDAGFTVTVSADGLAAGIPDRAGVLEAALQQAAWTARSVLGSDVSLRAELGGEDGTVEVMPDPAILGTFNIARPVSGSTYEVGGSVPITGTVPADTTALTFALLRSVPLRDGDGVRLVPAVQGEVAVSEPREDLGGRRAFAVRVPAPEVPGSYELELTWSGPERLGDQDTGQTFEVVAQPTD